MPRCDEKIEISSHVETASRISPLTTFKCAHQDGASLSLTLEKLLLILESAYNKKRLEITKTRIHQRGFDQFRNPAANVAFSMLGIANEVLRTLTLALQQHTSWCLLSWYIFQSSGVLDNRLDFDLVCCGGLKPSHTLLFDAELIAKHETLCQRGRNLGSTLCKAQSTLISSD